MFLNKSGVLRLVIHNKGMPVYSHIYRWPDSTVPCWCSCSFINRGLIEVNVLQIGVYTVQRMLWVNRSSQLHTSIRLQLQAYPLVSPEENAHSPEKRLYWLNNYHKKVHFNMFWFVTTVTKWYTLYTFVEPVWKQVALMFQPTCSFECLGVIINFLPYQPPGTTNCPGSVWQTTK